MSEKNIRFAFYGKGGIGKSTIVSNLTCLLASKGMKVLHIGCDPKADSCILLTRKRIPTVLEQLASGSVQRKDILFPGILPGIFCIESGGPQAGVGCAGMGISAMEETLDRLDILREDWDIVMYDVLGDVVCGGFAVPMREHYIDKVFVVTSSDFMSLYAANNIIHAVQYYSRAESLLGGMIWNHRASDWDENIADQFLSFTGTKLVGMLDEDPEIRTADFQRRLFVRDHSDSAVTHELQAIAEYLIRMRENPSAPEFLNVPKVRTQAELERWRVRISSAKMKTISLSIF